MRAKITYMWGDWPVYFVERRAECRDDTDRSAYDELARFPDTQAIKMGKVCVERTKEMQPQGDG